MPPIWVIQRLTLTSRKLGNSLLGGDLYGASRLPLLTAASGLTPTGTQSRTRAAAPIFRTTRSSTTSWAAATGPAGRTQASARAEALAHGMGTKARALPPRSWTIRRALLGPEGR